MRCQTGGSSSPPKTPNDIGFRKRRAKRRVYGNPRFPFPDEEEVKEEGKEEGLREP
jgi:hypothetical protein